jgi:hypothetical protein
MDPFTWHRLLAWCQAHEDFGPLIGAILAVIIILQIGDVWR